MKTLDDAKRLARQRSEETDAEFYAIEIAYDDDYSTYHAMTEDSIAGSDTIHFDPIAHVSYFDGKIEQEFGPRGTHWAG